MFPELFVSAYIVVYEGFDCLGIVEFESEVLIEEVEGEEVELGVVWGSEVVILEEVEIEELEGFRESRFEVE